MVDTSNGFSEVTRNDPSTQECSRDPSSLMEEEPQGFFWSSSFMFAPSRNVQSQTGCERTPLWIPLGWLIPTVERWSLQKLYGRKKRLPWEEVGHDILKRRPCSRGGPCTVCLTQSKLTFLLQLFVEMVGEESKKTALHMWSRPWWWVCVLVDCLSGGQSKTFRTTEECDSEMWFYG